MKLHKNATKSQQSTLIKGLIEEFPVGIGAEKSVSNLRQIIVGHHIQASLKCVIHFDFALTRQQFNTSSTEKIVEKLYDQ